MQRVGDIAVCPDAAVKGKPGSVLPKHMPGLGCREIP